MKNKQPPQGLNVDIPEEKGTPDLSEKGWAEKAYEQSPLPKPRRAPDMQMDIDKDLPQDNDVITQYIPPSKQVSFTSNLKSP